MKKSTRAQAVPAGTAEKDEGPMVRTTVVIPASYDDNLDLLAYQLKTSKTKLVKEATEKFIRDKKLDPNKSPRIRVES